MNKKLNLLWMAMVVMMIWTPFSAQAKPKESFKKVVLKNGLTVMYQVMKDQPMVSMYAIFPIGANSEKEKGIAHLLEHMVFRGGSGYTFHDILEVTNRQGGAFNGFTTFYATIYNYIVPVANFENAFQVFNGTIWKTTLAEPTVALERKIVVHESDMNYSNSFQYYPVIRYFFPEFQYTKEEVEGISTQELLEFHRTHYQPGNATYIIAGDFEPQKMLAELEQVNNRDVSKETTRPGIVEFDLPKQNIVENRNLYPYQYQLLMGYEFTGLTERERMILKLLGVFYGYDSKIDYERNEYKEYYVVTRSIGKKDYFGIYHLERNHSFSDKRLDLEKNNMLKYFREFKKIDFKKAQKDLVQMIEMELLESKITAADAVEYEVQRLINPDNLSIDSLPVLKKLTSKDLEAVMDTYFIKPPTTWILVTTNKTELGGN